MVILGGASMAATTRPNLTATSLTKTYHAVADARVEEAHASTNYGGSYLRTDGGDGVRVQTLVKFTVAVTGTVTSATLKLHARTDPTANGPSLYKIENNWTESGVTFSNRPIREGNTFGDLGRIAADAWVSYDVTRGISASGTYSFKAFQSSTDGVNFDSREDTGEPPVLVVTTTSTSPTPTPTTHPTATATATPRPSATGTPVPTGTPRPSSTPTPTAAPTPTATPRPTATPTPVPTPTPPPGSGPCGTATAAPAHYQHVIWILMENKSYSSVIGSASAPYENSIANQCATLSHWTDAGSGYNSEPNYVALTSGINSSSVLQPFTCDCAPSASISVTSDNLFRQVRAAGGTERSYQEGMSANCSNSGTSYASKHNPAEYFWGAADRTACQADDIPMGSASSGAFVNALSTNTLPTFSFVTPNLCNDTHDCSVATGDTFLKTLMPKIFASPAYTSGNTAVFVIWDEDTFIPNILAAPSIVPGTKSATAVNHYSALRATEEMLGLPLLGAAASATSLRSVVRF